jgi:hypothetical protein
MSDSCEHLELREVINVVDFLTSLCFMASSVVNVWVFVYGLSAVGCSFQFQLVSRVVYHGMVYFRATHACV